MRVLGLAASLVAAPALAGEGSFVDVSAEVGVSFVHQDGRSGGFYYVETSGAGGGLFDYDGDGDLDLFLINGARTRGTPPGPEPRSALYENREGRFVDVTRAAGLAEPHFGQGLCVGDADGDGLADLLVTAWGPDRLYRNTGDGRFENVAVRAGVADERWGTSCAFGDLDGDGDLDLYVARYVDFGYDKNPVCRDQTTGVQAYCRPHVFDGLVDSLFVNQGGGVFREEGARRGIVQDPVEEKGFGVLLSDLDVDGDLDIYVANDTTLNRLYVNDGTGHFEEQSLFAGVGLDGDGVAGSGMGVDAGDVDGDGLPDLVVTNYAMETNTLYRNAGNLFFEDATVTAGLASPSFDLVGWGVLFLDHDNDGDLDLVVANGHVSHNVAEIEPGASYPQRNQVFENDGSGSFVETGVGIGAPAVSRGLAAGDWNGDGRLDLLVTNLNGRAELLENRRQPAGHWLGLRLLGPAGNRLAIGARAEVAVGESRLVREVRSGGSFMSQSDLRLHFGLGSHTGGVGVIVHWPDGSVQEERIEAADRYVEIEYRR